jgi:hypothetical protein
MRYGDVLTTLDRRIDRLNRQKDLTKRLAAGVETLTALLSLAEELQARCHALQGVLELQVWVGLVAMGRLTCWLE